MPGHSLCSLPLDRHTHIYTAQRVLEACESEQTRAQGSRGQEEGRRGKIVPRLCFSLRPVFWVWHWSGEMANGLAGWLGGHGWPGLRPGLCKDPDSLDAKGSRSKPRPRHCGSRATMCATIQRTPRCGGSASSPTFPEDHSQPPDTPRTPLNAPPLRPITGRLHPVLPNQFQHRKCYSADACGSSRQMSAAPLPQPPATGHSCGFSPRVHL